MTTGERDSQLELLQRTLDLLILQTLAFGPAHGHAIARIIQRRSSEVRRGSLYPAPQRL
jgi:PadR family transcriptional regulator PadR